MANSNTGAKGSAAGSTRTGGRTHRRKNDTQRLTGAVVKLLAVVGLLAVIIVLWRGRADLSCANISQCAKDNAAMCGSSDGFPSTINGSSAVCIDSIAGSGIALLSDTSLTVYDSTAMEAAVRAHFMASPAMKCSGRYAMIIDLGSNGYRIESIAGTIASGEAENPLISCAISRDCRFALVMQGSSRGDPWLSSVDVRDRDGKSLHRWHCADWYITDAALSPDGSFIAFCGVNAEGGALSSAIIIQRIGSSEAVAQYTLAENMYLSLEYDNTNTLFAFGTSALTVITDSGKERRDIELAGELLAFDVNYDSGAAICTADEAKEDSCTVVILDSRGRERCTETVAVRAQTVSLGENACSVIGGGKLVTLRPDGSVMSDAEGNAAPGGLLLIGYTAYTVDGIRISAHDVSN